MASFAGCTDDLGARLTEREGRAQTPLAFGHAPVPRTGPSREAMMETVPQKYMDQAISGGNWYTEGMLPTQRFQLSPSQISGLVWELNDAWTGLSCRGSSPNYLIYDN